MDNLKSIDKKRNRKRGSYHVFLKYLKDNGIDRVYPFQVNKEIYLPMIDQRFPEARLLEQLSELQRIDTQNKVISQKFNGDIVMTWLPDLKGKELGHAITDFKESFNDDEEFREFVLNGSFAGIKACFMNTYNGESE